MREAVLLTCLTLCHARASLLEASEVNEATTCAKGGKGVATVPAPTALTVKCPESLTLTPESPNVFDTVDCDRDTVSLNSLVPGATLKKATPAAQNFSVPSAAAKQPETYTFTVVQMPPAAVSVFYLCKKVDSTKPDHEGSNGVQGKSKEDTTAREEPCTIEIQIAAANPLGPNTCAVIGGRIDLDLRAVNQTARFSCSPGAELTPQSATRAYDSTCKQEVDLPHGLARTKDTEYRVALKELPKRAQQLCYLCKTAKENKSQSEGCEVHVRTAGGVPRALAHTAALYWVLLSLPSLASM